MKIYCEMVLYWFFPLNNMFQILPWISWLFWNFVFFLIFFFFLEFAKHWNFFFYFFFFDTTYIYYHEFSDNLKFIEILVNSSRNSFIIIFKFIVNFWNYSNSVLMSNQHSNIFFSEIVCIQNHNFKCRASQRTNLNALNLSHSKLYRSNT